MTRDELTAIEQRAEAATPGPWVWSPNGSAILYGARDALVVDDSADGEYAIIDVDGSDAAFIAAARTDVPALCREVRRLTAELAAAKADTARLDWLEAFVNREPLLLHDGSAAFHGYSGLGLRPGALMRTLREAIDTARAAGEREP